MSFYYFNDAFESPSFLIIQYFIDSVCVYGGGDRKAQINNIETGVEIISMNLNSNFKRTVSFILILICEKILVATPGRLNDLVEAKVIDVCTITFLILDEGKHNRFSIKNKHKEMKEKCPLQPIACWTWVLSHKFEKFY